MGTTRTAGAEPAEGKLNTRHVLMVAGILVTVAGAVIGTYFASQQGASHAFGERPTRVEVYAIARDEVAPVKDQCDRVEGDLRSHCDKPEHRQAGENRVAIEAMKEQMAQINKSVERVDQRTEAIYRLLLRGPTRGGDEP